MEWETPQQLDNAINPMRQNKTYIKKGKRLSTVKVRFPTEQEAIESFHNVTKKRKIDCW